MSLKHYKELIVWQKSMELVKEIYSVTEQLPQKELYSLVSQMRRASISIPSNIAEGHRRGRKEFVRFLIIADGSSAELETHLILCEQLYPSINLQKSLSLLNEIQKMLGAMIRRLSDFPNK